MTRYLAEPEVPAYFRRADLVVLPHREVDQSGVLNVALAFGKPIVMSAVGGFEEVAQDTGAGRLVPPEDPGALAAALRELLADPERPDRLAARRPSRGRGAVLVGRGGPPYARPLLGADRMNVLYLSKHKRSAARALETLVERGCEVSGVVVAPAHRRRASRAAHRPRGRAARRAAGHARTRPTRWPARPTWRSRSSTPA